MTQQLLPPVGLHDEIVEVYREGGERPANELLAMLNTPGRIQRRGFPATIEQFLAVIIDTWRVDDDTRFFVYNVDLDEIAYSEVFTDHGKALALAEDHHRDCMVRRFDI